jgi:hypothetical protein
MYNTVEELHIALDQSLQNINSNRRGIIKPQEKDWLLNETQLRLIDSIMDARKNNKGYEDDQLNYDALLPVKENITLPVVPLNSNSGYAILPADYLHRDSIAANVVLNCGKTGKTKPFVTKVCKLHIPNDTGIPKYHNLKITMGNGTFPVSTVFSLSDYGYSGFSKNGSFFTVVELVIDALREKGIDVYWERYNNLYEPNTFFIIPVTDYLDTISIGVTYGTYTGVGSVDNVVNYVIGDDNFEVLYDKPTGLVSTEDINDMLNSSFFNTVPNKPIITLSKQLVIVYYTNDWFVNSIKLRYIKRPMLINSVAGQMTNLKNISDKIVQMTVQNIKAKIEDRGYQAVVNENLINN